MSTAESRFGYDNDDAESQREATISSKLFPRNASLASNSNAASKIFRDVSIMKLRRYRRTVEATPVLYFDDAVDTRIMVSSGQRK